MTNADRATGKICVICNQDCSTRPRTKDQSGRYFCKECFEEAKRKLAAKKAQAAGRAPKAPPPPPKPAPQPQLENMDDGFDLLAEAAAAAEKAPRIDLPEAEAPHVATPQRAVAQVAFSAPREKRKLSLAMPEFVKGPGFCFLVPGGILGLLFLGARSSQDMAVVYFGVQALFGLVVSIFVLIQAFRESIGTGFLTLCVPFYAIYFVFSVNESPHLKALFAVMMISTIAGYVLPAAGVTGTP